MFKAIKQTSLQMFLGALLLSGVFATFMAPAPQVLATEAECRASGGTWQGGSCIDCPTGTGSNGELCVASSGDSTIPAPTPSTDPIGTTPPPDVTNNPIYVRLKEVLQVLSVGVGIVVTISVVWAGFQYITSRGEPGKTQAAVNRLIQAAIALFLYIFGFAILNWLIPGGIAL